VTHDEAVRRTQTLWVGPPGARMRVRVDPATASAGAAGKVDRAPVLLLHGFTGTGEVWDDAVATRLRSRLVVRPDALGHGGSDAAPDPARHALAEQAAQVREALDRLGIDAVHGVGYSMGGRLLLALAQQTPRRFASLTLEGASPGIVDPGERSARRVQDELHARLLLTQGIEAFVARWEAEPLFATQRGLPAEVQARQRALRLAQRPEGLAASLRGAGQGTEPPRWEGLAALTMPVLFVAGEADMRYRAVGERVCASVPAGRLVVIAGSGHSPHLERFDAFWDAVEAFWESVEAPAGTRRADVPP